jgi:hypothetical protein
MRLSIRTRRWVAPPGLVAAALFSIGALMSRFAPMRIGPEMTATASISMAAVVSAAIWLAAEGFAALRAGKDHSAELERDPSQYPTL